MNAPRKRGRPPKAAPTPARTAETDVWMYSAEGPRLFKAGEEIPAGYEDHPEKVSDAR